VLRNFVATIGLEGHRRSRRWRPCATRKSTINVVSRSCSPSTRRASSLLPLKCGTRDRSSLLDPGIEGVVEEQIERFWLKKEKSRFSGLVERVHDPCRVEGLRAPHRKTIAARHGIKPDGAARRRGQGVWRRRLPFFTPSMTTAWLSERGIHLSWRPRHAALGYRATQSASKQPQRDNARRRRQCGTSRRHQHRRDA
jgi:hypothetical protein